MTPLSPSPHQQTHRHPTPHPSPSPENKSIDDVEQVHARHEWEGKGSPNEDWESMDIPSDQSDGAASTDGGQDMEGDGEDPEGDGTDGEGIGLHDSAAEDDVSEGGVERTLNPWAWSQKTNDEKVQLWELEDLIKKDRLSTAAARTKWMYQARLGSKRSLARSRVAEYYSNKGTYRYE